MFNTMLPFSKVDWAIMATMCTAGETFREWICSQQLEGYRIERLMCEEDVEHILLEGESFLGEANFYDMGDGSEIAELRITRRADGENVYFLHFMMDDISRAQGLFGEMRGALAELSENKKTNVLLCCTCGVTTSMFASRMNEVAKALSLEYVFEAKPLDMVQGSGDLYSAILLAPQVAHLRGRVAKSFPKAAVFEVPAKIFGSYDAPAAVRLVMHVLEKERVVRNPDVQRPLNRLPEGADLQWDGRIMVVSADFGASQSTFEYRVYEKGELVISGRSNKRTFSLHDIEDLLADVRLQGIDVGKLDAIGISVPGIVDKDVVTLFDTGERGYELGKHIKDTYGVPVFLDNDANAAAAGCYATQMAYKSITYHRESFGHGGCGQGTILDGVLLAGSKNFAGELNHLVAALRLSGDPEDLAWTEDGMYELVSRFVLMNACTVAPEAVYVDAWPVTDMERLHALLVPFLTEEYVPKLIVAPDFTECMLLGELALCVQRLRQ